jgi:hypothetical protein
MPSLSFQTPAVLLCLAVVPLFWLAWRHACARARRVEEQFRDPDRLVAAPANVRRGLLRHAALTLLIVGLAGPAWIGAGSGFPGGAPVVFVLDVSPSMAAPDAAPDRLAVARLAIRYLCLLLPDAPVALVAAGGDAAVVCPPTADRDAFLAILDQASTGWMPAGTDLSSALEAARRIVTREGGAAVVLVSDGENHGPSPEGAIAAIRQAGGVVHTIVVGSAAGVRLSLAVPAETGQTPLTQARPEAMAAWARLGGGRAWRAPDGLPGRGDLVIPRPVQTAAARKEGRLADLSPWLYAVAALLLAASVGTGSRRLRRRTRADTD